MELTEDDRRNQAIRLFFSWPDDPDENKDLLLEMHG